MIFLSGLSLLVSMIGLYILLFASFSNKADQQIIDGFINKQARKIRFRKEKQKPDGSKPDGPSPQFILLLKTIIIGELVGLFFLLITDDPQKHQLLNYNSIVLLMASFLCSVLTLFNVWIRKTTNIMFRIILQVITLVLGIILIKFSEIEKIAISRGYFSCGKYAYYITVVIALATMLFHVIFGNKTKKLEFDYSNYLIIVIVAGLVIGSGLLLFETFYF